MRTPTCRRKWLMFTLHMPHDACRCCSTSRHSVWASSCRATSCLSSSPGNASAHVTCVQEHMVRPPPLPPLGHSRSTSWTHCPSHRSLFTLQPSLSRPPHPPQPLASQEHGHPDQGRQDLHHGPPQPGHHQNRSLPGTCTPPCCTPSSPVLHTPILHPTQHEPHSTRPMRAARARARWRSATSDWACSTSTRSRPHLQACPTSRCVSEREQRCALGAGLPQGANNADCVQVEFYIDANGILKVGAQTSTTPPPDCFHRPPSHIDFALSSTPAYSAGSLAREITV